MTSDVFRSLIRYHQMWLDLPAQRSNVRFKKIYHSDSFAEYVPHLTPKRPSNNFSNFMTHSSLFASLCLL